MENAESRGVEGQNDGDLFRSDDMGTPGQLGTVALHTPDDRQAFSTLSRSRQDMMLYAPAPAA
jgi:hypothetical protein